MKLLVGVASVAQAAYFDATFMQGTNSFPVGIDASSPSTFRPYETNMIDILQVNYPGVVDVNMQQVIEQNSPGAKALRQMHKKSNKSGTQLIDYQYLAAMQVVYEGDAEDYDNVMSVVKDAFTGIWDNTSSEFNTIITGNSISFPAAGPLHGNCQFAESECRALTITTNACYNTNSAALTTADESAAYDALNLFSGESGFVGTGLAVDTIESGGATTPGITFTESVGTEGDSNVWMSFTYTEFSGDGSMQVCGTFTSSFNEQFGEDFKSDSEWFDYVNGVYSSQLGVLTVSSQSISGDYLCTTGNGCTGAPDATRCEGVETYNADLSGNGFLAAFGPGHKINKVVKGRGDANTPYDSYGNELYHLAGDTVRLECELGYVNGYGKEFMGAVCTCENGVCAFKKNFAEWTCVSEAEQAIPVWTGAVFNFIKGVFSKYVVLKASARNLMLADQWTFDRIDHLNHPEYASADFWKDSDFTMFVWCPFNVLKGGNTRGTGKMTFADFYPGEHSDDGHLWSFLSREGTRLYRAKDPTKSSYFKGFIDRSTKLNETGPVTFETGIKDTWTCETGILPGHHPNALYNMKQYFHIFKDGDFRNMVSYLRTNAGIPSINDL